MNLEWLKYDGLFFLFLITAIIIAVDYLVKRYNRYKNMKLKHRHLVEENLDLKKRLGRI